MITPRQNALYWREWAAAKRALMPGRSTWTKYEESQRRHKVTIDSLGYDKSHSEFTNKEFDLVLGGLRAISQPGNLGAQLRQVRGDHVRALYALERVMKKLGVDRNYVQGIIDHMDFSAPDGRDPDRDRWEEERERSARPRKFFGELTFPELQKVIIALRLQLKRKNERAEHRPGAETTPGPA
jgi:hypothetical protein